MRRLVAEGGDRASRRATTGGRVSPNTENIASLTPISSAPEAGAERLHFKVGPFTVEPGQNNIANRSAQRRSNRQQDGWIVGIRPNLEYANGKTPGVDVIHLHHAVWLNLSAPDPTSPGLPERFFAVGEEKTNLKFPPGYGYAYKTTDHWLLNYMLHNLTPDPAQGVGRATTSTSSPRPRRPRRTSSRRGRSGWTCRTARPYPVFDVPRGGGHNGEFTYPDDANRSVQGWSREERVDRRPGRRAALDRRATCTPAGCATTSGCNATARVVAHRRGEAGHAPTPCTSSRRSRTTTSPPDRCRGT